MTQVALLGSGGYVGSAFAKYFRAHEISFTTISRKSVDIYSRTQLRSRLVDLAPAFLINCAGYTGKPNVDACEKDKVNCLAGNAVLPGIIAEVCTDLKLPWGHVSSGCIYTGSRDDGSGFRENDPPNFSFRQDNCSYYSGTKALGEEILADFEGHYVWRLRIPFNHVNSRRNYISKLLTYDKILDARNSLSHLDQFVEACWNCFANEIDYGVYNLTNGGSVTARDVIEMILNHGLTDKTFTYFDDEVDFMAKAAITPRSNCVLDNSKAISAGLKLDPIEVALEKAIVNWTNDDQDQDSLMHYETGPRKRN